MCVCVFVGGLGGGGSLLTPQSSVVEGGGGAMTRGTRRVMMTEIGGN